MLPSFIPQPHLSKQHCTTERRRRGRRRVNRHFYNPLPEPLKKAESSLCLTREDGRAGDGVRVEAVAPDVDLDARVVGVVRAREGDAARVGGAAAGDGDLLRRGEEKKSQLLCLNDGVLPLPIGRESRV